MKKKVKYVFATSKEGNLYVKVAAIMTPLCAMLDGLSLTFFGKGKTPYLAIDTAIDWVSKEMKEHSREKYTVILNALNAAKKQHADSELIDVVVGELS